ncbi:uncharacterized protein LOC131154104 isoform X2 [Malania oleifera]|uniref:uncharacterized protein LOC131154104 isoform X2 n=1 Tax=Malania oleifera TaxID=397392 RepID=UPI0025AEA0BE|nr:uncharacterized protein LOC131154104 isoform X2 [Malania oleifera]
MEEEPLQKKGRANKGGPNYPVPRRRGMTAITSSSLAFLCNKPLLLPPKQHRPSNSNSNTNPSPSPHRLLGRRNPLFSSNPKTWPPLVFAFRSSRTVAFAARRKPTTASTSSDSISNSKEDADDNFVRRALRTVLWIAEGVYVLWLFLLPYAPGDPVWAINSDTINSLVGLSLNFFFVLPLMNSAGIYLIDAPVLHPMAEGLFNFVIGWTLMFAPLLFTDRKNDRYKGSLDVLWGLQMFLTNTFLIPYMAIRLNDADLEYSPREPSQLGSVMINGAPVVGLIGGAVCVFSVLWGLFGRMDGDFGSIMDRLEFLISYLGSERLAYAFIWDICLYIIFQPWLIGDNLQNVQKSKAGIVNYLRFVPVIGLAVYLICLDADGEL